MSAKMYFGTHKVLGIDYHSSNKQDIIDALGGNPADISFKEMDMDNYILRDIPEEFHGPLKYLAYEQGHSCGESEVLSILGDLVDNLLPAIQKFEKRVVKDYEDYMYL